jgi:very-short-patch-repair endonuclease
VRPAYSPLATAQSDVVLRSQLTALGTTKSAIRSQVRGRRWTPIGAQILVLHNGPLTRQQREWAAVLTAGRDAGLAGRTALALGGLKGWETDEVHLLTPRGRTPPRFTEFPVVIHETRWPASGLLGTFGSPPRTPIDRSAIDAALWSPRVRTACAVLAAVVQQRLTTPERLLAVLDRSGPIRHRRDMTLALGDIAGGAQALTEIDFHRFCRQYNLGKVRAQKVRTDASGRRRYLDVEIESPDGTTVAIEIDGALHLLVETYWRDMDRGNELVIAGHAQLRYPSISFRLEPTKVADQVRRALAANSRRRAPFLLSVTA